MTSAPMIVVLCTVPDEATGERLARMLIGDRLAACVNILGGVRSIYRWRGAIEDAGEVLLVIKTRRELFEPLRARLVDAHPYDVPEVVALPVDAVHEAYARWLVDETVPPGGARP